MAQSSADLLAEAVLLHHRWPMLPDDVRPRTPEDAYDCQRELVDRLLKQYGGTTIGYKIACTNELAQRQLHVNGPFRGRLLSSSSFESGVRLDAGRFFMRVMEAEFAFRMAA